MEPDIGAGKREQCGDGSRFPVEHFLSQPVNRNHHETGEKNTDGNEHCVSIVDKEVDEASQHDIEKIAGRVGLVHGDIEFFEGKHELAGIHMEKKPAGKGDSRDYSRKQEYPGERILVVSMIRGHDRHHFPIPLRGIRRIQSDFSSSSFLTKGVTSRYFLIRCRYLSVFLR